MAYAEEVYDILKTEAREMDAVYEDYITHLVGICGLRALLEEHLLESCGVIRGRELYVLVDRQYTFRVKNMLYYEKLYFKEEFIMKNEKIAKTINGVKDAAAAVIMFGSLIGLASSMAVATDKIMTKVLKLY